MDDTTTDPAAAELRKIRHIMIGVIGGILVALTIAAIWYPLISKRQRDEQRHGEQQCIEVGLPKDCND